MLKISIVYENGAQQAILDGENVTEYLRQEEVGNMASVSSANPKIREKLVQLQRILHPKKCQLWMEETLELVYCLMQM